MRRPALVVRVAPLAIFKGRCRRHVKTVLSLSASVRLVAHIFLVMCFIASFIYTSPT
jgi:hypothetical protein